MLLKLLTSVKLKRTGITFASIFGLIWLFLEPAGLFLPEWLNWGWRGYLGLASFSLLCAIEPCLASACTQLRGLMRRVRGRIYWFGEGN